MAAAEEKIIEEILNSNSSAGEEIVHIINNHEGEDNGEEGCAAAAELDDCVTDEEALTEENKELVFCVPGLLMAGREQQKITVTQDELRRRVAPPECLSQTMLVCLLRLSKEKGKELKQTLAKNGIKKLTSKSAIISCFTKLTETEATQLAEDYFYLASRNLRLKEINREIVSSRGGWDQFETQANMTKELLQDILKEIEARDTNLTLMTHGFSPLIIRAVIDILIEIITYRET